MSSSMSMEDFDERQFSSTSTPNPNSGSKSSAHLQLQMHKRQLVKDMNTSATFASPAYKRIILRDSESTSTNNDTLSSLFAFDKQKDDPDHEHSSLGKENILLPPRIIYSSSSEEEESTKTIATKESDSLSTDDVQISINEISENMSNSEDKIEIVDDSIECVKEVEREPQSLVTSVTEYDRGEEYESKTDENCKDSEEEIAVLPIKNVQPPRGPLLIAPQQIYPQQVSAGPSRPPPAFQQIPAQHGRLYGGKMTEERMQRIKGVSNNIITTMHQSLSTIPENVQTDSPKGLRIELMRHQKIGLSWLLWREQQVPPSGTLADDMGLGKTLSMIALILHKKNARKENPKEMEEIDRQMRKHFIEDRNLIASNSTLVVAPASLIFQWEKEVRERVMDNKLRVHVFHGPKNKREIAANRLSKFDIVITTYDLLVSELKSKVDLIGASSDDEDEEDSEKEHPVASNKGKGSKSKFMVPKHTSSVLTKIAWERVILDEAHEIRNKASLKSRACCRLDAVHRWCLTGTPIHNKLWDLFSLIRFLQVKPFSEEAMWKEFIMTSNAKSSERLNTIVKNILLRRTKSQICDETKKPIVDLQPKKFELINLSLQRVESHCYSIMFEASKQKVRDLLKDGGGFPYRGLRKQKPGAKVPNPFIGAKNVNAGDNFQAMSCILALLLRLRQACVHFWLTKNAIDVEAFKQDDADNEGNAEEFAAQVLEMSMAQMSLDESVLEKGPASEEKMDVEKVFEKYHPSTKIVAVLSALDRVMECGDKCVIVSQWTTMLSLIEFHLQRKKIGYTSITGEVKTDDRQSRVDAFNRVGSGPRVMLLSLTAGGVGLNLVGGNHLFLVDLHWNPALEQQACDRIYRLGQKKSVFIHKFICNETIEQRVLMLQEKKTALATSVLEGAASKKITKLTRDELMFLFELDKRTATNVPSTSTQPVPNKTGHV